MAQNFQLHPGKFSLFSTSSRWCGSIIAKDGIRFDTRRIYGIRSMASPMTGEGLQQFVCAMQWMGSSIPAFSSIIRPLGTFLEDVYLEAGQRTCLASAKVLLESLGSGTAQ